MTFMSLFIHIAYFSILINFEKKSLKNKLIIIVYYHYTCIFEKKN